MKYALLASGLFLVLAPPAQAQFFRRLFGGGQQHCVQQVALQQPVYYQQQYQQQYYPTYQAVAAIPLTTIPVAVDLQAYQFAVNAQAFQSFRDYQASKVTQATQEQAPLVAVPAPVSAEVVGLTGAGVLKQRCASCHTSGKIPRFFDGQGNLLATAPLQEMLDRMTNEDPQLRMPPKSQLPTREVMVVMNYAVNSLGSATEKVAVAEPAKRQNPFE